MKTYGTREEVYNGLAKKTRGGLTPNDIIKRGDKYISKRMSNSMKIRFKSQKKKDTPISTGSKFKISTSAFKYLLSFVIIKTPSGPHDKL